ncbi:MAG: TolC family protein [Bdellovibrio sp.]|nr:TolC family protein [Bdellovibrio sp.]
MPQLRAIFLALSTLSLSSMAWAQQPLSFQDCLELLKKNNADLQYSESTYESSKYQIEGSKSGYFPQLSASLGYSKSGPDDSNASSSSNDSYSATLNASQNLFRGFTDSSKVDIARGQSSVAEASLRSTRAQVSYDLKFAFASVIYAKDSLKISEDIVKRRGDNLRIVELRFESGRENKGSLLLSQANLKQAKLDHLKAQHGQETSQSDLKKVIGVDSDKNVEIKDDVPLTVPSTKEPDFTKIAASTPDRQQFAAQVDVAEAQLTSAKSGFFPTLDLTGSVGQLGNNFYPNENDRWTVGATLTLPFFSGGKDYYATKSQTSQLYAAKSNLAGIDRSLLTNLKKAFTSYVEAVEELSVNESFVTAARTRADIARAKYNNGLMSFEDWDNIENDLINKTKLYLTSKRDRIIAEAAWEKAQGVGALP